MTIHITPDGIACLSIYQLAALRVARRMGAPFELIEVLE